MPKRIFGFPRRWYSGFRLSRRSLNFELQTELLEQTSPDAAPARRLLKMEGIRMVLLSNFTSHMMNSCVMCSGLGDIFERLLSTDQVRPLNPIREPMRWALKPSTWIAKEILFVAHGGWDAAGAKIFGYSTYWVNRLNLPPEGLGVMPDGTAAELKDLAHFIQSRNFQ